VNLRRHNELVVRCAVHERAVEGQALQERRGLAHKQPLKLGVRVERLVVDHHVEGGQYVADLRLAREVIGH
jgi:hypothetical protein